jgi:hypothetical protein
MPQITTPLTKKDRSSKQKHDTRFPVGMNARYPDREWISFNANLPASDQPATHCSDD